jgi:drug/metabolite transporter (DMT)-like permease
MSAWSSRWTASADGTLILSDRPSILKVSLILAAGLATFAFAPILVRLAGDAHPLELATIRTVSAALFLLPFWLYQKKKQAVQEGYTRKEKIRAILAGGCLGLHFIFWIASLGYTSVASASVLVTTHPILLILIESLLMKRHFSRLTWIGVFTAFAGSVWLGLSDSNYSGQFEHATLGNMMALTASALFVLYFILSSSLRQKSTWTDYIFRVYFATAVTCTLLMIVLQVPLTLGLPVVVCGIALALGPQILGHGSLNYAVKYISPTILSTLILTEPVFATILALILFAELPLIMSIIAMFIILTGVLLSWLGRQALKPAWMKNGQ